MGWFPSLRTFDKLAFKCENKITFISINQSIENGNNIDNKNKNYSVSLF